MHVTTPDLKLLDRDK